MWLHMHHASRTQYPGQTRCDLLPYHIWFLHHIRNFPVDLIKSRGKPSLIVSNSWGPFLCFAAHRLYREYLFFRSTPHHTPKVTEATLIWLYLCGCDTVRIAIAAFLRVKRLGTRKVFLAWVCLCSMILIPSWKEKNRSTMAAQKPF